MDAESEAGSGQAATTIEEAPPWSQRDRRIFLGAVSGAAVVGMLIVFA